MARLTLENGTVLTDATAIAAELAPLNIGFAAWPTSENPEIQALLAKDALSDEEKEQVLASADNYFAVLQAEKGYKSRDLIVVHPAIPNLGAMLAKFEKAHTHDDDEVRYIVAGEGTFGFVRPDGSQVELTVQAGEYCNVPAGTDHWFHMTPLMRIKAVRYFSGMDGWVPRYTETPVRFSW